jgi:8-oxo-dGTP pyrophosphatase MutT (NUDIX family)
MQAHPSSAAAYADNGPSPIDRGYQLAYCFAYRLMRTYWRVRRPLTHGAVVAIWNAGEVLLVRNSYVSFYTAPGGYVRGGEGGVGAAVREIGEEVGMRVDPSQLKLALDVTHDWEFKHDHVQIFDLELAERPMIKVDHREVIEAAWFSPKDAVKLNIFPPLKTVIERRL